ncbi:MAG: hypothetical protein WBE13_22835 [Candidatus Acidiferrum sp.]
MSFSLRLTADLTLAMATRAIGAQRGSPLVLRFSTDSVLDAGSSLPSVGGQEISSDASQSFVEIASRSQSPIIWIDGSDPLDYPGVARLANSITASRHHVFLETCGALLKPRLHEFQPSSNFYFAVRFDCRKRSPDQNDAPEAKWRIGLEALRMARLAGFFTCARLLLHPGVAAGDVARLHGEICKLDIDGFLITSGTHTPELERTVEDTRRRLLSRRCALLSSSLDASALSTMSRDSSEMGRPPLPEPQQDRFGEGAGAG